MSPDRDRPAGVEPPDGDRAAALVSATRRVVAKLRNFNTTLDRDEQQVLAMLLVPAVASAFHHEGEVHGFQQVEWAFGQLADVVAATLRTEGLRVVGLAPSEER